MPSAAVLRAVAVAALSIGLAMISNSMGAPPGPGAPWAAPNLRQVDTLQAHGTPAPALHRTIGTPATPALSVPIRPGTTFVAVLQTREPASGPPQNPPSGAISQLAADGIPATALDAYQRAASRADLLYPGCGISWPLLAAIGRVESDHGRFAGSQLYADGESAPPIIGIALNGVGTARIMDTDQGRLDGDRVFDHAVGPMQFIPGTWRIYGVDGNADGRADPFNIYDAAAAAADYLCIAGGNLTTIGGQTAAVLAYNESATYLSSVLELAAAYAGGGVAIPAAVGLAPPLGTATLAALPPPARQPGNGPLPPVNPGPPLSPPGSAVPLPKGALSAPSGRTKKPSGSGSTSSAPAPAGSASSTPAPAGSAGSAPTPSAPAPSTPAATGPAASGSTVVPSPPATAATTGCPSPTASVTVTVTVTSTGTSAASLASAGSVVSQPAPAVTATGSAASVTVTVTVTASQATVATTSVSPTGTATSAPRC